MINIGPPPSTIDAQTALYLRKLITAINTSLQGTIPRSVDKLPDIPGNEIFYFKAAIGTEIPTAGIYYHNGTVWVNIA